MSEAASDDVGIKVGTQTLSGWQEVRITRGIEDCPPTFDLALTEKYPTQDADIIINPGDPCQITIGNDTVLTGYVDDYFASVTADSHTVRITGRGMAQDLVDCSAELQTFQINNTTLVALATKLCQPFGITVSAPDGDSAVMPQFNVILTETPFEIIERVARWANKLVYEDTDGNLVIAGVGDTNMASGFVLGSNLQAGACSLSRANRYTEMRPVFLSNAFLTDPPPAAGSSDPVIPYVPGAAATDSSWPKRADGQPRYRPLIVVSEQVQNLPELAKQRTAWDMARRYGRSQQVTVTCDSWRDSAGTLWAVNALALGQAEEIKVSNVTWLIASVVFERGERGTTAEVVLMPKEAFVPAPDILLPYDFQLSQSLPNGGATNFGPAPR